MYVLNAATNPAERNTAKMVEVANTLFILAVHVTMISKQHPSEINTGTAG